MKLQRSFLRRVEDRLLWIPATLRMLGAAISGRPVEMWIGDSHAMSSNRSLVSTSFMPGADGVIIVRLGARLMYSLASGFPRWSTRLARVVGWLCRPGQIRAIFMSGEIDVRVHLVEHADRGFGFVQDYVSHCREYARLLGAHVVVFALPPPPCDTGPFDIRYPVVGTLEERVAVWRRLRSAVMEAAEASGAQVLDFSADVAGPDGALRQELTDDGAHTNAAAIPLIRAAVRRLESQTNR